MKIVSYTMPRPFSGYAIPIAIQSVYLRDYCNRNNFTYPLPITEFCIKNSFHSLNYIIDSSPEIEIFVVSIFVFSELDLSIWPTISMASSQVKIRAILENKSCTLEEALIYLNDILSVRRLQCQRLA